MTAKTYIFLMTHYCTTIVFVLLAVGMWLYLGISFRQSIKALSWEITPFVGLEPGLIGHRIDGGERECIFKTGLV